MIKKMSFLSRLVDISPYCTAASIIFAIIMSFIKCSKVLVFSAFLEQIVLCANGAGSFLKASMLVVVYLVIMGCCYYEDNISDLLSQKIMADVREKFVVSLIKHLSSIRYEEIENQKNQDQMTRLTQDIDEYFDELFQSLLELTSLILQLLILFVVISSYNLFCGIVLVVLVVPLVYLAILNADTTYKADESAGAYVRKADYYFTILTNGKCAADRNVYGFNSLVERKWKDSYEQQRKILVESFVRYFTKIKVFSVGMTLIVVIMLFFLSAGTDQRIIPASLLIALTGYLINFIKFCTTNLVTILRAVIRDWKKYNDLQSLCEIEQEKKEGVAVKNIETIELKNVTFVYPENNEKVLDNVSLLIEKGKKYALVGENGAGKTTVMKLLLGMYSKFQGEILINGIRISDIDIKSWRELVAVVFQAFGSYELTLRENVVMSSDDLGDEKLYELLRDVGLETAVDKLPNGIDTVLLYGGDDSSNLSKGQWQKIAVARAFARKAEVCIFDEMTSSIDPSSEFEIYKKYMSLAKGKTSIYITHRLGIAKNTDEIIVFDKGKVVERGSHIELMKKKGQYYRLFETQRNLYE